MTCVQNTSAAEREDSQLRVASVSHGTNSCNHDSLDFRQDRSVRRWNERAEKVEDTVGLLGQQSHVHTYVSIGMRQP